MSKTAFTQKLTQFKTELNTLYQKAQAMFLRHGATHPHAEKSVMPHLAATRESVDTLLKPEHDTTPKD